MGARGGAVYTPCKELLACSAALETGFGALMDTFLPRVLFGGNAAPVSGSDIGLLEAGLVQVDGLMLLEDTEAPTVLVVSGGSAEIEPGTFRGPVSFEIESSPCTPPKCKVGKGKALGSKKLAVKIGSDALKPIGFGLQKISRRALSPEPWIHWYDHDSGNWTVVCDTQIVNGTAKADLSPEILNSGAFKGPQGVGEILALYADEDICTVAPVVTTSTTPATTPKPPGEQFTLEANNAATILRLEDGAAEVEIPANAVQNLASLTFITRDFDSGSDGSPNGDYKIASKVIIFQFDQILRQAFTFKLKIDNLLRRALGEDPFIHWFNHNTEEWEVVCDTTYDEANLEAKVILDTDTLNSAAFKGSGGGKIAAFYRDPKDICDGGLGAGEVAGIVIGALVLIALVLALVVLYMRSQKQANQPQEPTTLTSAVVVEDRAVPPPQGKVAFAKSLPGTMLTLTPPGAQMQYLPPGSMSQGAAFFPGSIPPMMQRFPGNLY